MRLASLTFAIAALMAGSAYAAPPIRTMLAEQVADAPSQQDEQQTGKPVQGQTESPSKKLSQTNGVIHPPPTGDHTAVKPPPHATGESVISPPGTPGGDQTVQPK